MSTHQGIFILALCAAIAFLTTLSMLEKKPVAPPQMILVEPVSGTDPAPEKITEATPEVAEPMIFGRHSLVENVPVEDRPWTVYRYSDVGRETGCGFSCPTRAEAIRLMERLDSIEDAKAGAV